MWTTKHSRIKQYHKEGRALRTETVINDTYDFAVGRRLKNLDDLKQIGFAANRRLLRVETLSHDCTIGADVLDDLHRPTHIDGQRTSALRFGDPRVQAVQALLAEAPWAVDEEEPHPRVKSGRLPGATKVTLCIEYLLWTCARQPALRWTGQDRVI